MAEQRLIDANALIESLPKCSIDDDMKISKVGALADMITMIANAPTVDPARRGHWVFDERWWYPPKCSACNGSPDTPGFLGREDFYYTKFRFCSNCGAHMVKEDKSHDE